MKTPLVLDLLSKSFGSLEAVSKVSFSLKEGEIFGLLGPNGAGKTTTLSIIAGLEKPTSGTAQVFGYDILKHPQKIKTMIGMIPQELTSQGFFNVEEILQYISGYFGIRNNRSWIDFLLKKLDLFHHRKKIGSQLSGGMKRRLMIAKALVHKPKLLFLDEPTAGVDIELRESLWNFMQDLNKEGTTIFLTTHYLQEAEALCDRIGVMGSGKLLRLEETKKLIHSLTHRKITIFLKNPIGKINNPYLITQNEKSITFQTPRDFDLSTIFSEANVASENIYDIAISEGNLEDAFRNILGGSS